MIEGKTKSGFKFSVDERVIKSKQFVLKLAQMNRVGDNPDAVILEDEIEDLLLGEEQKAALSDHLNKKADGYAEVKDFVQEVSEILDFCGERSAEIKNV